MDKWKSHASVSIAGRRIAADAPPYVIAEMSGNHNGDLERAKALITAARDAGADAVKLQTYTADTLTIRSDRPEFRIKGGLWDGQTLYELYEEAHTPWDWHAPLFEHARKVGITIFSSPFDETAVDLLELLGAPAYKIASAELVDWGLLERVARTDKPVIISTGMANDTDIEESLGVLRKHGCNDIILLHCISEYPTPIERAGLGRIQYLARKFDAVPGLSDHSMGNTVAITSVALGACLVEKHFTLARADGGVDSAFSLEAQELAEFCNGIREAHAALGVGQDFSRAAPVKEKHVFRRSLYVVAPVAAGEVLTRANVRSIRPGLGLEPKHMQDVLGKHASEAIPAGTPLDWNLIDAGAGHG